MLRIIRRPGILRELALIVHRYVGLSIALFLILEGLTGSVLAFYRPLDAALNPELFRATPPAPNASPIEPFALLDRLNEQLPASSRITDAMLQHERGRAVIYEVAEGQAFVNPYTGVLLGQRDGTARGWRKTIPGFIYSLHATLALGDGGTFVLGLVALLWTMDCFVGAYLTFPRTVQRRSAGSRKTWLRRWFPMWLLKTNKLFALIFTWHRASGLWLWGMLFVFAWSGVALNYEDVYDAVTHPIFGEEVSEYPPLPELEPPGIALPMPLREAHVIGQRLMASEAQRRGFAIYRGRRLSYHPENACFFYSIESSLDISEHLAETWLAFDASGRTLAFHARTGFHAGSTVKTWLVGLHFGAVRAGGLAYRCFVCVFGLAVALLSVTGVWIWWKQRHARAARRQHATRAS